MTDQIRSDKGCEDEECLEIAQMGEQEVQLQLLIDLEMGRDVESVGHVQVVGFCIILVDKKRNIVEKDGSGTGLE